MATLTLSPNEVEDAPPQSISLDPSEVEDAPSKAAAIDYQHPAGAPGGYAPTAPTAPAVDVEKVPLLPKVQPEAAPGIGGIHPNLVGETAGHEVSRVLAIPKIVQGVKDIAAGNPEFGAMEGQYGVAPNQTLRNAPKNPQLVERGANEVLQGVTQAGMVLGGPEALAARPIETAVGLGAGYLGQKGAEKIAKATGATPEAQQLAGTVGGLVTGGAAAMGTGPGLEALADRYGVRPEAPPASRVVSVQQEPALALPAPEEQAVLPAPSRGALPAKTGHEPPPLNAVEARMQVAPHEEPATPIAARGTISVNPAGEAERGPAGLLPARTGGPLALPEPAPGSPEFAVGEGTAPPSVHEPTARTRIAPTQRAARPVPAPARGMTVDESGNITGNPAGLLPAKASPASQDIQQVSNLAAYLGAHPLWRATGIDEKTGLPIVRRREQLAEQLPPETLVANGENLPPQTGVAGPMSPEAEAASAEAATRAAQRPDQELAAADQQAMAQPKLSGLQKGARITLPDGAGGTVTQVHPQTGIVQVHADDGENVAVRQQDLTPGPGGGIEERYGGFGAVNPVQFVPGPVRDYLQHESELIRVSREIHSGLQDLDPKYDADVLRANQLLDSLPGTPADQEQIYHHLEDPKVPLNTTQHGILDQLQPLEEQSEAIFHKLYPDKKNVESYVHRIAQQKGGLLDRILSGSKSTGKGNLLRKSTAAGKKRSMLALESPAGRRQVVSVGRGRVTAWRNGLPVDIGPLRAGMTNPDEILDERLAPLEREEKRLIGEQKVLGATQSRQASSSRRLQNIANRLQEIESERAAIEHEHTAENLPDKLWRDRAGNTWTFKQATTKEIERETPVQYYKNAAASVVTNWLELRKAERAYDFLEGLKDNPDFQRLAIKPRNPGQIPEGWKSTQLPQFIGYYFEPHIAEILDHYNSELRNGDPGIFARINNFLTTTIFLNPIAHIPNLTVNWLTEKGISPIDVLRWGTEFRAGVKAFNAVVHQNSDFLEALDAGAPLQSQKLEVRTFAATLAKRLQEEAERPEGLAKLKAAFGSVAENNPLLIPGAVRWLVDNLSSRITWPINDLYFLQSAYAKMWQRGMSLSQALKDTATYIPDERLPVRVFNSKALGDLLRSPALMFTRYHYGVLKGWGQILKNLSGLDFHEAGVNAQGEPINAAGRTKEEEQYRALGIAAGLALALTFVYPEIDKLLAEATGNKDARIRRPGYLTVADAARRVIQGDETPLQAARTVVTPSVLAETAADLAANRDLLWDGRRIYNPQGTGKEIAEQIGTRLAGAVSPAELAMRAAESDESTKRVLYSMIGISFPKHGALRLAAELQAERVPDTAETPEERKKSILRSQARYSAWQGDMSGIEEARKSGLFSEQELCRLNAEAKENPLLFETRDLPLQDVLKVWRVATPNERQQLLPILVRKLPQASSRPKDERKTLRAQITQAIAETRREAR